MRELEMLALEMGAHLIECWEWPAEGGCYSTDGKYGLIHLDVSLPIRRKRWLLAHELGHHWYQQSVWHEEDRAEGLADRWAVKTLLEMIEDLEDVDWPLRVWHLLEEFQWGRRLRAVA